MGGQRRATIRDIAQSETGDNVVFADVPLKEMIGYSTSLRSLTQGTASYSMEFLRYDDMSSNEQNSLLKSMRGY